MPPITPQIYGLDQIIRRKKGSPNRQNNRVERLPNEAGRTLFKSKIL
jgi:hypothetical protein